MSAYHARFEDLKAAGNTISSVPRSRIVPKLFRQVLIGYYFPKLIEFVVDGCKGSALATLEKGEAQVMYNSLSDAHEYLVKLVNEYPNQPWWKRKLMDRFNWFGRVSAGTEEIEEILETLAWGLDPELHQHIERSVEAIGSRV